jgi:pimeloyl-ACP methyl ester carboxylesterase
VLLPGLSGPGLKDGLSLASVRDDSCDAVAVKPDVAEAIARHESAGRRFEANGVESFVREEGDGDVVVLAHGVPVSSFVYRRIVPELAGRGLRAVAFDMPGLGLAERPSEFDYTWSGLAAWLGAAIDALGIGRCHVVAHDIGGPVVLEWAVRNPDRVLSLTALDTIVDVARFHRPWPMHPFSINGIGELWLRSMARLPFREIYYLVGIGNRAAVPRAEVDAHHALLKRVDGGRSFLRIMRGFELTEEKERFFFEGLSVRAYPAQVVWGSSDRMLGEDRRRAAMQALGVEEAKMLPAKHFLQEDQAEAVADAIAGLAV